MYCMSFTPNKQLVQTILLLPLLKLGRPGKIKTNRDHGVQTDGGPAQADFFFGYPTAPGYEALRDVEDGSWYISVLCEVFCEFATYASLDEMHRKLGRPGNKATIINSSTEMTLLLQVFFYPTGIGILVAIVIGIPIMVVMMKHFKGICFHLDSQYCPSDVPSI